MGILLGLATALSWGSSDFISRAVSRKIGALRAVLFMQAWGFLLLSCVLGPLHGGGHLFDGSGWHPWAWGVAAGLINAFAMLALYQSFAAGKLSVVAPVSASYPALTVLLAWLSGESLTFIRYIGVVATILGVVLVARGETNSSRSLEQAAAPSSRGILWAVAAACGFGTLLWLLGIRIIPATGPIAAVWLIRATGVFLTLVLALVRRQPVRISTGTVALQTAGMGILDTGAFLLCNLGMQLEQISIVSVLGSLYGAVTVGLATLFLRERVRRLQWCGIILIFLGVFLISW